VRKVGKVANTRCVFALVKREAGKPRFFPLQIDDVTKRQAKR
jgi:hypothetical protein